jgi:maltose O-acetyltransferase
VRTEKEKMLAGELYDPREAHLAAERRRARNLCKALNASGDEEQDLRGCIIRELFGSAGEAIWIAPPFYGDYGTNISVGDNVFFNFNCVVLDPAPVRIGTNVVFGPAVQIYTATYPLNAAERRRSLEFARAVEIESDVWIGGGAIICPGVRIGSGSVVGAGSVVTRDIPDAVLGVGNPLPHDSKVYRIGCRPCVSRARGPFVFHSGSTLWHESSSRKEMRA